MAFHVPFEYRRQRWNSQPIYIGFDSPPPPGAMYPAVRRRRRFNWIGFHGFWLSLVSLIFTLGLLSPISLVLSMIGLRRRPRKLAIAGTFFSLIGTAIIGTIVIAAASASHHASMQRKHAVAQRQQAAATATTLNQLRGAEQAILDAKNNHDERLLPAMIDGNEITVGFEDAWGNPLAYAVYPDHVIVRSAGPDGRFGTTDDISRRIAGVADEDRFVFTPVAENPVGESEQPTKSRRDRRASAR